MATIKVSIVIPTYNRVKILDKCLNRFDCQDTKLKYEVIVIDDGFGEDTKKICQNHNKCLYIYQKNAGPAKARNTGIRKAKGEIIILINDDCMVENNFVGKHYLFHKNTRNINVALVGLFLTDDSIKTTRAMKWLDKSGMHFKEIIEKEIEEVEWHRFWTGNCSLKKSFFNNHTVWFDTDFKTAAWEDIEFAYRANKIGMRFFRDSSVVGIHLHKFDFKDVFNRFFSHGRGLFHLSRKLPKANLPPLARLEYRVLARLIMIISVSKYTGSFLSKLMDSKKIVYPDLIMLYLTVYWKLKGFDYEARAYLSRN